MKDRIDYFSEKKTMKLLKKLLSKEQTNEELELSWIRF